MGALVIGQHLDGVRALAAGNGAAIALSRAGMRAQSLIFLLTLC
jgi:hypothetical protein